MYKIFCLLFALGADNRKGGLEVAKDTCSYQALFCEITEFPAHKRPELTADTELHWINALHVNKQILWPF